MQTGDTWLFQGQKKLNANCAKKRITRIFITFAKIRPICDIRVRNGNLSINLGKAMTGDRRKVLRLSVIKNYESRSVLGSLGLFASRKACSASRNALNVPPIVDFTSCIFVRICSTVDLACSESVTLPFASNPA